MYADRKGWTLGAIDVRLRMLKSRDGRDRIEREIRFGAPGGIDTVALAAAMGAAVVEERPGEYVVGAEASPERVAALTAWLATRQLPLADLRAGRQSLEDVFLRLTGDRAEAGR